MSEGKANGGKLTSSTSFTRRDLIRLAHENYDLVDPLKNGNTERHKDMNLGYAVCEHCDAPMDGNMPCCIPREAFGDKYDFVRDGEEYRLMRISFLNGNAIYTCKIGERNMDRIIVVSSKDKLPKPPPAFSLCPPGIESIHLND